MILRRWFPTFYRLSRFWRERFTFGGKMLTMVFLFTLPSLGAPDSPLLLLLGGSLALLIAAGFANAWRRVRLGCAKPIRATTTAGQPVTISALLENQSDQTGYDLKVSVEAPDHYEAKADDQIEAIEPGGHVSTFLEMNPVRRGAYALPRLRLTSSFPLNLVRSHWRTPLAGELVVFPRRANVSEIHDVLHRHDLEGDEFATSFLSGRSSDYEGSREYQPGIPVRRWDYSSWARTGNPVVREFGDDQKTSFAIAIDPTIDNLSGDTPSLNFEALMSLTVGVAHWLIENDRQIGAVLLGDTFLSADTKLDSVLDMLARAQPTADDALDQLSDSLQSLMVGQDGVLFLTAKWDDRRARFCEGVRESRPLNAFVVGDTYVAPDVSRVSASDVLEGRRLSL